MDIIRDDILQSLTDVENITIKSEMNVLQAMSNSYQKIISNT